MNYVEWEAFWSNRKYVAISDDDLNKKLILQFIKFHKEIVYSLPNVAQCLFRIGIKQNNVNNYKFVEDIKFPEGTVLSFSENEKRVRTLGDVFRSLEYDKTGNLINKPSLKCNDCESIQNLKEQFTHKQIELPFNVPTNFESKEANSNQEQNSILNSNDDQIPNETILEQLDDKINEVEALKVQLSDQSKKIQALEGQLANAQKQLDDKINEVRRLNSQLDKQSKEIQTLKGQLASTQKQLDDKINEVGRLNSQLDKQLKEIQTLKGQLASTQKQLDDKINEVKRLNSQLNDQSKEIQQLKDKLADTKKKFDDKINEVGHLNSQLDKQLKEIQTLNKQLAFTERLLEGKNKEIQNLNSRLESLQKILTNVKKQLHSEYDEHIIELEKKLTNQQQNEEKVSKLKQIIKQLQFQKQTDSMEIATLKKRIAELDQLEQRRKEALGKFIAFVILLVIPIIFIPIHDACKEADDYIKRQGGIIATIESFFNKKPESKTELSLDGVALGNEISDAEKIFGKPDSMDFAIYPEPVYYTGIEPAEDPEDKASGDEYYLYFNKYNLEVKVENEHIEGLYLSDVNDEKVDEKVLRRNRCITTPRGIHLGSTYEDIIEAYDYSYETISRGVMKYSFTGLNNLKGFIVFTLYLDDIDNIESGAVRSISMFFDRR